MPSNSHIARYSPVTSILVYLILISGVALAWFNQKPANDHFSLSSLGEFSQQKAMDHLQQIAQQPHYTGSEAHQGVHDYIVSQLNLLGLEVSTQQSLALSSSYFVSSEVKNIIARLPANNSTVGASGKALALLSHYDSATTSSFGASDAGSGVVAIIESLRAFIASGHQHTNDIIVIISDAEEIGLLGAEAFVAEHPWANDVGLVLNFEARGSGGASFMLLETNGGNSKLIEAFKQADVPFPTANSLMYSIYKMLPNDTDLTVFREQADINGFNFAFIDDHFDYHTAQDTPERLDLSSLNHQGSYLQALLPYFANVDLSTLDSDTDYVYFNIANWGVIDYPFAWVLPISIALAVVFLAVLVIGFYRRKLTFKHVITSFLPVIVALLGAAGIGYFGWALLLVLFPEFGDIPQGFTYSGHWIIALSIVLTVGLVNAIYRWLSSKKPHLSTLEWLIAPCFLWLLINFAVAIHLTGAGFLSLMLIAPLIYLAVNTIRNETNMHPILYVLLLLPALIVISPQIPTFVIGLGLSQLFIATLLTALVMLVLAPVLVRLEGYKWQQSTLLVMAFICLVGMVNKTGYSIEQKKPTGINYVVDIASKKAVLFSYNRSLDSYTQQVFSEANRGDSEIEGIYPISPRRKPRFTKTVEMLDVSPINYSASSEKLSDTHHKIIMTVTPTQSAHTLQLTSNAPLTIESLKINNKYFGRQNVKQRGGFVFKHQVTSEQPISIEMIYSANQALTIKLLETRLSFAELMPQLVQREDNLMPTPFRLTDAVIVSETIVAD